jgi:predicted amidohydrolase YtcJ
VFKLVGTVALTAITLASGGNASNGQNASDMVTIFTARKIVTMDPGWPEATAVAVQNGRIISVATLDELKPWINKFPHQIDRRFHNNIIYPGFVEPHGHQLIGGTSLTRPLLTYFPVPNPYGPAFPGVKTKDAALKKLAGYVSAAKDPNQIVVAWGYDVVAMGGHLDKNILDKVSSTQPILVWDASEHFVYANTASIKKGSISKDQLANTPGVRLSPDGESNGQFLGERAAQLILAKPMQDLLAPAEALKNMKYLADLAQQAGITTTSDLAFGLVDPALEEQLMRKMFNNSKTHQRAVVVVDGSSYAHVYGDDAIVKALQLRKTDTDTLMFNGVKFFSDDAFLSLGMEVQNPGYIHSDKYKGLFMFESPAQFVDSMTPWWNADFHIHVHTNGNAGNQATIDALAVLQKRKARFDHRFTFEHFGISTPEQARQVRALGGVVSINPYYLYARGDLNAPEFGADRAYTAARLKTLSDAGVVLSLHADTPVAPPRPLEEVWIAVNRLGAISKKVLGPAERVPVLTAMRMITIDAAYTLGVEDKVGSIQAGKFADFTVLDRDPMAVDPKTIRDIRVLATVLGGRVIMTSETSSP